MQDWYSVHAVGSAGRDTGDLWANLCSFVFLGFCLFFRVFCAAFFFFDNSYFDCYIYFTTLSLPKDYTVEPLLSKQVGRVRFCSEGSLIVMYFSIK